MSKVIVPYGIKPLLPPSSYKHENDPKWLAREMLAFPFWNYLVYISISFIKKNIFASANVKFNSNPSEVVFIGTAFVAYILNDSILLLTDAEVRKHDKSWKSMLFHHMIFLTIGFFKAYHEFLPYYASMLMQMEVSTIILVIVDVLQHRNFNANIEFGFKVLFMVTFFLSRVIVFPIGIIDFVLNLSEGWPEGKLPSIAAIPLMFTYLMGFAFQIYLFKQVCDKAIDTIRKKINKTE